MWKGHAVMCSQILEQGMSWGGLALDMLQEMFCLWPEMCWSSQKQLSSKTRWWMPKFFHQQQKEKQKLSVIFHRIILAIIEMNVINTFFFYINKFYGWLIFIEIYEIMHANTAYIPGFKMKSNMISKREGVCD